MAALGDDVEGVVITAYPRNVRRPSKRLLSADLIPIDEHADLFGADLELPRKGRVPQARCDACQPVSLA